MRNDGKEIFLEKLQIKGKICERWKTEKLEKTCPVIPQRPKDRDTPFHEYNS